MKLRRFSALITACAAIAAAPARFDAVPFTPASVGNIGSATMSGRISAVAATRQRSTHGLCRIGKRRRVEVRQRRHHLQAGVRKAPDAQSIGAVTIDPRIPKNVWAGTARPGSATAFPSETASYKSTDGGENWTNIGCNDSERIAKILVDPRNGNSVLACATGHLWDDNDERGVYKTTEAERRGARCWQGRMDRPVAR